MYKIVTNSIGTGNWITILDHNNERCSEIHRGDPTDYAHILSMLDWWTDDRFKKDVH